MINRDNPRTAINRTGDMQDRINREKVGQTYMGQDIRRTG